jgi:hypothetical protein
VGWVEVEWCGVRRDVGLVVWGEGGRPYVWCIASSECR